MSVNLSIKNVPDGVAEALRARARENHRSLQQELLMLVTESVEPRRALTPDEVLAKVRALELATGDQATDWVRAERARR